jgi:predicted nucleic acid-binding protein
MSLQNTTAFFRANYLDASAIVKVLVDEPDCEHIQEQEYFKSPNVFYMTSFCFAEALGVLKVKLSRGEITKKGYANRCYLLTNWIRTQRVKIDEVPLTASSVFEEVESLARQYGIDVSDALQIVTIRNGKYSNLVGESKSVLITADRGLTKAARNEGLMVWDCIHEPIPQARDGHIAELLCALSSALLLTHGQVASA